ncbi:MAG: hypothetical protein RLZZ24_1660 [Pseudomonadota bacterium]|jgi:hypothetical protein
MKTFYLSVLFLFAVPAWAQMHPLFKDADMALGEKLIAENKCNECHIRRVGGDGSAMYKPKGRINNAGALRGMVEYCNTELNLGFFPEDTNSVAAVLNQRFYKFR